MASRTILLRFALVTAVVFAAAGASAFLLVRGVVQAHAQKRAVDQAQLLADTTLGAQLRPSDVQRLSPARRRQLDFVVEREIRAGRALLVRIVSPAGILTYTSDHTPVGGPTEDLHDAQRALQGDAVGETSYIELEGRQVKVLETYVPVRLGGETPIGVLEIYRDYAPVASEIRATVKPVTVVLVVALLFLFLTMLPILHRVGRTLDRRTERLAEQDEVLRRSEEQYRTLVEHLPVVTYIDEPDATNTAIYISPQIEPILGYTPDEWLADPEFFPKLLHPDDHDRVMADHEVWLGEGGRARIEYRLFARDGRTVWFRDDYILVDDEHGRAVTLGFMIEISEQKALELQFLQSQKLEVVGQLAGGIAHDFNNLLQAIGGFSELLLRELDDDSTAHGRVVEITRAADRASELTRQLLAFSRKQILQSRVLDLNEAVRDMTGLLRRVLGEDIEFVTSFAPDLWPVRADSAQLEQVLLNLVVNARDAMPVGGRLTVKTANVDLDADAGGEFVAVVPGPYLMLTVSDTGCGMDAATQARIFEPFFTTKDVGQGTGLGLSTVYGIVKQSGGYVFATSEVGQGTTFSIYLPAADEQPQRQARPAAEPAASGRSGTILLVEDEPAVRAVVCEMLANAGYTVLTAESAVQALEIEAQHEGHIDLLVTDAVLPGLSGIELISRMAVQRPAVPALLISGYAHGTHGGDRPLPASTRFLQKPFTNTALIGAVEEALQAEPIAST